MITGPTTHSFISQRLRLRYVDWGNPSAPPLILLHGGRDHSRSWDWTAQALRDKWHVIAPDLRGHGDSDWSPSGDYGGLATLYDLAQLIHQQNLAPVTIVAHSYGGNIALRYAGVYPANVKKLVAIEGLGPSPKMLTERLGKPIDARLREWIDAKRKLAGHPPHRYKTLDEAFARMKEANHHLSDEQARHLTVHGVSQNEDGTFTWKFDPYMRVFPPFDMTQEDVEAMWNAITCPTLLIYGADSWASDPEKDGRAKHFKTARVVTFPNAGHWVHHDQFDAFVKNSTRSSKEHHVTNEFFVDPTRENFNAFKALPRDTPIEMLNLICYRDRALYPEGHSHASRNLTGAEAYAEYGRTSEPIFTRVGGKTVWRGKMEAMVTGPANEQWDAAFIARYPNAGAFLAMITDPNYKLAVVHRQAAVLTSRLVRFGPLPAGGSFAG